MLKNIHMKIRISFNSKFLYNVFRLTITVLVIIRLIIFQAVIINLDSLNIDLITFKPVAVAGCTAVLISHRFEITAGHCLESTNLTPYLIEYYYNIELY